MIFLQNTKKIINKDMNMIKKCINIMPSLTLLTLSIISNFTFAANTEILILDATVKDKVVKDAEVIFQRAGETSVKTYTDNTGKATTVVPANIDDKDTTLIVKAAGYSTLAVKCPCNGLTYAISPNMQALDGMRVVLSWGDTPSDLDSHLVYPNNHIYFESKVGRNADLDVDDTDSYGPETVTIKTKRSGETYYYAVHNFSQRDSNNDSSLSNSDAKVFVYIGSTLIKTYYIPKNKEGTLWSVFYIDENGEIHDINKFSYTVDSSNIKNELPNIAMGINTVSVSTDDIAQSKKINRLGEQAYHAKDLDAAIQYYQEAIQLDPNNGQAYSNLGLAFQKNNNEAEAIWANRKAIALANGPSKNTIQASSYYNIAKIYEEKGEFQSALTHYELALEKKQHDAYVKGIDRMKKALK